MFLCSVARWRGHLHMDGAAAGLCTVGIFLGLLHLLPGGRHSGWILGPEETGLHYNVAQRRPNYPESAGGKNALPCLSRSAVRHWIGSGKILLIIYFSITYIQQTKYETSKWVITYEEPCLSDEKCLVSQQISFLIDVYDNNIFLVRSVY